MYSVEVQNLWQNYRRKRVVLKDVSFRITQGAIHGLIGNNGAGKTTIIKSIVGALPRYRGTILINGISIKKFRKNLVGYLPDKMVFPHGMTCLSYVTFLGYIANDSLKETRRKSRELFTQLRIDHLMNAKPNNLSTGERKKVMLVQAILNNPEILVLDEPASNLDPLAMVDFFALIKELNAQGKTILITSHNLHAIDNLLTEVTLLEKGEVLYTGDSAGFKQGTTLNEAYIRTFRDKEAPGDSHE